MPNPNGVLIPLLDVTTAREIDGFPQDLREMDQLDSKYSQGL